jgi:hypothetical protein
MMGLAATIFFGSPLGVILEALAVVVGFTYFRIRDRRP